MRLRYWAIAIALGTWWMWPRSAIRPIDVQAAATSEGFVVLERTENRLIETDFNAKVRRTRTIASLSKDTRVVGTPDGPALIWQDGNRVAFARADDLRKRAHYGKQVKRLCSQTATSQNGFAVAWVETGGRIRALRGETIGIPAELAPPNTAADPVYCGVSQASNEVALLWQIGDRVELVRCDEVTCKAPRRVLIDKTHEILGFAGTYHYAMVATRDRAGVVTLHWLDEQARTITTRTLNDVCRDSQVVVTGERDSFAIAYSTGPHAVVLYGSGRDDMGNVHEIWRGGDPNTVPALAWTWSYLLIPAQQDGKLVMKSIPGPIRR
jgi:hypothetical protein